jgi:uncharacterized protein YrzB (UPF0473 family)
MSEHNHDCDCGCSCGCGHDHDNEQGELTVTLTLEDGSEMDCLVLSIFPVEEQQYIALLPMEEIEGEEGEVYLYRFTETEDGDPELSSIEDDEEYEKVADAFDEFLDAEEFDEMFEEDDE